ncbi:MAG: AAA family ATPase [Clostridiaceae bacterium]|nr:AAA family ATPase [Clostridiaceae bacterium]
MKEVYFQMVLGLRTKIEQHSIDLVENKKDIQVIVDKFNKRFHKIKKLYLLKMEKEKLVLALELLEGNKGQQVDLRTIRYFTTLMKRKLQLDKNVQTRGGHFKCINIEAIDNATYEELIRNKVVRKKVEEKYSLVEGDRDDAEGEEDVKVPAFIKKGRNIAEEIETKKEWEKQLANTPALEKLVGLGEVKKQLISIETCTNNLLQKKSDLKEEHLPMYLLNTLITSDRGTGKFTIAKTIFKILCDKGIFKQDEFITIEKEVLQQWRGLEALLKKQDKGVIYIKGLEKLVEHFNIRNSDNMPLQSLLNCLLTYREKFIFIMSGDKENIEKLLSRSHLHRHIKFYIDIPDYNNKELFSIAKQIAKQEGYLIKDRAELTFLEKLLKEKKNLEYENIHTVRKIVEEAIVNKNCNGGTETSHQQYELLGDDFIGEHPILEILSQKKEEEKNLEQEKDPLLELQEMIGLNEVKQKIQDIISYLQVQKKRKDLGMKVENICLHMEFTGNPGTGKTTVARIIGRILRQIGILEEGNFVEVGREDLVAEYIGQTAIKTAQKIKQAHGGVLFVDEAYSLDSASRKDFGSEALATLVKRMEDDREKLAVILAGYPEEMESLINKNPGLRDRIQFSIHFPDYKPNDMVRIFEKFCLDQQYTLNEEAELEVKNLFGRIYENRGKNFSNGRLVRKCFERVKMLQARRLQEKETVEEKDLTMITYDDIQQLHNDTNLKGLMVKRRAKVIGFSC